MLERTVPAICLPSLVKICNSLAVVIVGLFATPFIVEPAVNEPDENVKLLLATVNEDPPLDANRPLDLNVWAFPSTSLLLFSIWATSSIVLTPVRLTLTELESDKVTVKFVRLDISAADKPNYISGWFW